MTTAVQVQYRRGTAAQVASFTGAQGELIVDSTNSRIVVQDGVTAGGWPAAKLSEIGGGFLNRFRNATMDVWQRGTAPSLSAGTSGSQYTADGWIIGWTASSSAAPAIAQAGGRLLTKNSLQLTGASNITDVKVSQRIESLVAAALCSQMVTVQAQVYNNTGGTITPQLTVTHAASPDVWTSPTTDVNAANLQSCANGAWTLVAYTFQASASAYNGLQVAFDFGNNFSSVSKSVQITELDIRVTSAAATGLNSTPPPPELRPVGVEMPLCQRYASLLPSWSGTFNTTTNLEAAGSFALPMRATPSLSILSGGTNGAVHLGVALANITAIAATYAMNQIGGYADFAVSTSTTGGIGATLPANVSILASAEL
jgi:hypothetical protein